MRNLFDRLQKLHWILQLLIIFFILVISGGMINIIFPSSKSTEKDTIVTTSTIPKQNITSTQPITPTTISTSESLKELFTKMKKVGLDRTVLVETEDGSIQAIKQDDEAWVVTQIKNNWPELFVETSVKLWVLNFMKDIYRSDYSIKQAGITINAPKSVGKYVRAFLGINQAKTLTEEDWEEFEMSPTNFYNWLKNVETSREESDKANRTFVEDNL